LLLEKTSEAKFGPRPPVRESLFAALRKNWPTASFASAALRPSHHGSRPAGRVPPLAPGRPMQIGRSPAPIAQTKPPEHRPMQTLAPISFLLAPRLSPSPHGGGAWRRHSRPAPRPSLTFLFFFPFPSIRGDGAEERCPSGPLAGVCVHPQVGAPPSSGSAAAPFASDRVAFLR
jgi:hypothetical protein